MRRYLLLLALSCPCLIAGCQPSPAPLLPTATGVTVTPRPTLTPAPVPTQSPTATATTAATEEIPSATPDIIGTVIAGSQPRLFSAQLSPNGQWRAEVVIHDCVPVGEMGENAYEQLKIIHAGDGVEMLADVQLQYCGGLGAFGLQGLFWSPNSRFFYYTDAREGVPDGCGYWEPPIISFDVTMQKKAYLGDGPRSPDGTRIAAWQNQELVIWDVNRGEMGRVAMRESGQAAGPIAWSSNSRALVYVRTTDPCPPRGKSYVGRIDLTGLKQTTLLASEAPSFEGVEWDGPNRLRLFDEEGKKWQYDFATHRLELQR